MDLIKTLVWKQIIESLSQELGVLVQVGGIPYRHVPRFHELLSREGKNNQDLPGIHYVRHTISDISIIIGPFRTDDSTFDSQELSDAYKYLPRWESHYDKLISLSIKHAIMASQQVMDRRKAPDMERLLFSYWRTVRQSRTIDEALHKTLQFLINNFKIGNATIVVHNNRTEHFAISKATRQAEQMILAQMIDTKTICTVNNSQEDFMFKNIKDKDNLPNCIAAFPLIKKRELIGYTMLYGDNIPPLQKVNDVLQELLDALLRISEYERVKESAITDSLTGLHNRAQLASKLDGLLSDLRSEQKPLSIIMIDADNFKQYNDTKGHPEGDKVLRSIAQIIRSLVPDNALACRYGGEEFLIALPHLDQNQAKDFAENVRKTVQENTPLTISLGMITCMNSSGSRSALIKQADDALYRAKHLGKNKVVARIMLDKYLQVIDA